MTEDPFVACLLTESNDMETFVYAMNLEYAWAEWVAESCVERNGTHLWELEGDDPDDGSGVDVRCRGCSTQYPDYGEMIEMMNADLGGLRIIDGRHRSLLPFTVPVGVEVGTSQSWTEHGIEYDAWLEIEPTGPVVSRWA